MEPWDAPEPETIKATPRLHDRRADEADSFDLLGESRVRSSAFDAPAEEGLDVPVPVALRLREAGLLVEGRPVQVITTTPPPVRREEPRLYLDGVRVITDSPPPVRRREHRPALQYTAPAYDPER